MANTEARKISISYYFAGPRSVQERRARQKAASEPTRCERCVIRQRVCGGIHGRRCQPCSKDKQKCSFSLPTRRRQPSSSAKKPTKPKTNASSAAEPSPQDEEVEDTLINDGTDISESQNESEEDPPSPPDAGKRFVPEVFIIGKPPKRQRTCPSPPPAESEAESSDHETVSINTLERREALLLDKLEQVKLEIMLKQSELRALQKALSSFRELRKRSKKEMSVEL